MLNVEIPLPSDVRDNHVEHAVDKAIVDAGLAVTLRDTLKAFPGCVHWHVKNGRELGTLEITFWPQQHRAWFSVQDGRKAPWIEGKMKLLGQTVEKLLAEST